jgi:excisionase family DNA binding protein
MDFMSAVITSEDTVGLPEAARRLGLHRATVNDMVRSGRLTAHREGAHWRVCVRDLEDFARGYVKPPNAPATRGSRLPASTPQLLELLREFGTASPTELAALVGLHEGNVRKHLRLLELEGLVLRRQDGEWELGQER